MYCDKYIRPLRSLCALQKICEKFFAGIHLVLVAGVISPVSAQLDNSGLFSRLRTTHDKVGKLYLGFNSLGYNKNNEYYETTVVGATYFGFNMHPELIYVPHPNVLVRTGVFLQKDFGNADFVKAIPTLTFEMNYDSLYLLFGIIQGPLEHKYIEPLYDFEKMIFENPEEGIQLLYKKGRWDLDGFGNWQRMIYDESPFREQFTLGVLGSYALIQNEKFDFKIPLQTIFTHVGGQIDDDSLPAQTVSNAALGVDLKWKFGKEGFLHGISSQNYYAYYYSFEDDPLVPPYNRGDGWYLNLTFHTHLNDFMLSYWRGQDFIGFSGGDLYQSVSRNWKEPLATESIREVLIFRILGKIRVSDDIFVTPRFEPYWNLQTNRVGVSFGIHIKYQQDFFLTKVKK